MITIRVRVALMMLLASLVSGGTITALAVLALQAQARADVVERARLLGEGIAPMAVEAIAQPDNVDLALALDARLNDLRSDPAIRRVAILDAEGRRVPAIDDGEAPALRGTGEMLGIQGDTVLVAHSFTLADARVGFLAVELTWPRAWIWLRALGFSLALGFAMLISAVAAWLISSPATADLRRLHAAIERLGRGETWAAEELREGPDEIGRLGRALRELALRVDRAGDARARYDTTPEDNPEDAAVTPQVAPVEPAGLLQAAVEAVRPRIAQLDADLSLPAGLVAQTDATLLRDILDRLLDNAARHTEGAQVALSAFQEGGDTLVVSVQDTGPGLSDRAARYLFRPVPGAGGGGFGLGLALANRHALAIGGRLSWDSRYHRGARFLLRVPLRAPTAERGGG